MYGSADKGVLRSFIFGSPVRLWAAKVGLKFDYSGCRREELLDFGNRSISDTRSGLARTLSPESVAPRARSVSLASSAGRLPYRFKRSGREVGLLPFKRAEWSGVRSIVMAPTVQ